MTMSDVTKIEWADKTWSPWHGCTKVSPGCANCYAETWAKRFGADIWGQGKPRRINADWDKPRRWNERAGGKVVRVFPSLCDVFDAEVPAEWLERFLCLVADTPHLTWLVLTKRPELVATKWGKISRNRGCSAWLPDNLWLGVSVEDQARAAERIPVLPDIPIRWRWISVEPMIGPVDLFRAAGIMGVGMMNIIDWVVVGGESGPGARPCDLAWIRAVVEQCRAARVPCFAKQLGSNPVMEPGPISWPITHLKGGDPMEWPEDLRVREWPPMAAPAPDEDAPSEGFSYAGLLKAASRPEAQAELARCRAETDAAEARHQAALAKWIAEGGSEEDFCRLAN